MIIHLNSEKKRENLLELLRQEKVYLPAYCNGRGVCGKCKIRFVKNAPQPCENEKNFFSTKELEAGWRLACETEIFGEAKIEVLSSLEETMEIETSSSLDFDKKKAIKENQQKKIEEETKEKAQDAVYTVAIDIGTTTIAASKLNIRKVEQTVTSVNHQRIFGADVVSRMEASNRGEGLQLQELIQKDLENLLENLQISKKNTKLIISGNTTMQHLLQGYSCETLGVAPYTPVDISLHQYKNMTILPGVSTYVGADIVSGIIACGMNQSEKISMLVDIGTNGEMAIGNQDRILVTSTAAGPAFEGGNISCGMASVQGAISSVDIENGQLKVDTIGGKEPIGICGSGVLETTYELLKNELIDETGLLDEEYFDEGYPLGNHIRFTAKDIREVQLAKSAIRTGIEVLTLEYGISYGEIDKLYLAGGFGQHMDVKKAVGIGLLPEELEDKVIAVGNTSLAGAILFATDEKKREQFTEVASQSKEVSLAENKAFQELYLDYMFFPEWE